MDASGEPIVLLRGKSTPGGGWALVVAGIASAAGGFASALFGEETTVGIISLLVGSAVLGAGLFRAGQLLLIEKGGVLFDPRADAVLLRGAGRGDVLVQPAREVTQVRLVPRDETWGREAVRNWSCELLRAGCSVVVAESTDYDALWTAGRRTENRLPCKLVEQGSWSVPGGTGDEASRESVASVGGSREVRARAGGRLVGTLAGVGVVGVAVGAALMSQVAKSPIFGFVFGPTLLFLGLAFTAAAASARFAIDEIAWDTDAIRHRRRFGPLSWGARSLERAPGTYLRVRHRGLRGADLELVGPRRTLVLVGAVTRASGIGYDGLMKLGDEVSRALGAATRGGAAPAGDPPRLTTADPR